MTTLATQIPAAVAAGNAADETGAQEPDCPAGQVGRGRKPPRLSATNYVVDPPLRCGIDLLVRIDADLSVELGGDVSFFEPYVTVVELAYQLHHWVESSFAQGKAFVWDSMDDERLGVIGLHPTNNGGWMLTSCERARPVLPFVPEVDLLRMIEEFIEQVCEDVLGRTGVKIRQHFDDQRSWSAPLEGNAQ